MTTTATSTRYLNQTKRFRDGGGRYANQLGEVVKLVSRSCDRILWITIVWLAGTDVKAMKRSKNIA
jgi:hypothetical protein